MRDDGIDSWQNTINTIVGIEFNKMRTYQSGV